MPKLHIVTSTGNTRLQIPYQVTGAVTVTKKKSRKQIDSFMSCRSDFQV